MIEAQRYTERERQIIMENLRTEKPVKTKRSRRASAENIEVVKLIVKASKAPSEQACVVTPEEFDPSFEMKQGQVLPVQPLPRPEVARFQGLWWVRCQSAKMVDFSVCYERFMNANALNQKDNPCFNCPLGKIYREKHSEGLFQISRFDTLLQ